MNTIKSLNSFHKRVIVNLILLLGAAGIILFSYYCLVRMPGREEVPPLASPQEFASHGIIIPETTYCLRYYNADGDRVTRFREYILFSESDILIDEEVKKKLGVDERIYQYNAPYEADSVRSYFERVEPKYRKYLPDEKDEIHEYFYNVHLRLFKTEKGSYLLFVDLVL